MKRDIGVIRELARQYRDIAFSDQNLANHARHRDVNDLKGGRPLVLIDEIPWHEMAVGDELTCVCETEALRGLEWHFRRMLYEWEHLRVDKLLPPYVGVYKRIHDTGWGIDITFSDGDSTGVKAHQFADQIQTEEDIQKLQFQTITYDEEATLREYALYGECIGDILPVQLTGRGYMGCTTWDLIPRFHGMDTLFFDMLDRPQLMHKLVERMTDIYLDNYRQHEELGLLDGSCYSLHCTAGLTRDLSPEHGNVKLNQIWGRGAAQILGSVSPQMLAEFDIQYMARALAPFGLNYYGCCEPLHDKIDVIEKIPNLRKISVTPWADIDVAAERIGRQYVLANKPNPAAVATENLNEDAVREELNRIVDACYKNNCSCDMVLKDITTVCKKPQTLWRWAEIAMEVARKYE